MRGIKSRNVRIAKDFDDMIKDVQQELERVFKRKISSSEASFVLADRFLGRRRNIFGKV